MLDTESSKQEIPQVYVNTTYKKKLFHVIIPAYHTF